jgi:histone H3
MEEISAEKEVIEEEKKNKIKKKVRYFETYISKILKNITPENGITNNAKQQLNSCIFIISKFLSEKARELVLISKKRTMSVKQISNAVKLTLGVGEFRDLVIKNAEDAVDTFLNVEEKHNSRQDKAGIIFPPSICEKFLRNFDYSKIMITSASPVYFASVLEFIATDILIISSKIAKDNNHVRITIRDLEMAVRGNKDLSDLFNTCNISFIGGGVVPEIHESLLNKKRRKKNSSSTDVKKSHRFRPGTICLREIRKFQKSSNCLTIAKLPFERLVRSIINNGMKISKDTFIVLQYYIEQFLVNFLKEANAAAIHCNRVKLMPSDITFICNIRKYDCLNTTNFKKELQEKEEAEEHGSEQDYCISDIESDPEEDI